MNLIADSGAILKQLTPLPLHSDLAPPSFNMCWNPVTIPKLFVLVA